MKFDKSAWINLAEMLDIQSNGIRNKSANLKFDPVESGKNGGTETLLGMIINLESTLRVFKRRLRDSLPSDNGSKDLTEGQKVASRVLMGCNSPIGTPAWDYLREAIAREIDGPIK